MKSQLVIVRGLPGSGKTTLAKEIALKCGYVHFENDMYFETEHGYQHDQSKLTAAQHWCHKGASDALLAGQSVVVSNVFTKVDHMKDFLNLGNPVTVIECKGNYGSVHGVPEDMMQRMRDAWEPYNGAVVL